MFDTKMQMWFSIGQLSSNLWFSRSTLPRSLFRWTSSTLKVTPQI